MKAYVVQQGTHTSELFSPLRLHASIVSACLSVRAHEGEAHDAARHVCSQMIDWLIGKREVTSTDVRKRASRLLEAYHPDAAYIYSQERLML